MMPGGRPQAAGDESSLGTGGRKEAPVLEAGATEELLEDLWKLGGSGQPQRPGQHKTSRTAGVQRRTAEGWWMGWGRAAGRGRPPAWGLLLGVMEVLRNWMVVNVAQLGEHA